MSLDNHTGNTPLTVPSSIYPPSIVITSPDGLIVGGRVDTRLHSDPLQGFIQAGTSAHTRPPPSLAPHSGNETADRRPIPESWSAMVDKHSQKVAADTIQSIRGGSAVEEIYFQFSRRYRSMQEVYLADYSRFLEAETLQRLTGRLESLYYGDRDLLSSLSATYIFIRSLPAPWTYPKDCSITLDKPGDWRLTTADNLIPQILIQVDTMVNRLGPSVPIDGVVRDMLELTIIRDTHAWLERTMLETAGTTNMYGTFVTECFVSGPSKVHISSNMDRYYVTSHINGEITSRYRVLVDRPSLVQQ
ncbi:hypothetical protein TREMEDRAFT_66348 [Tremella mesenterica DSM 1558]|uniref:uncharacterized protein n=1 Tax=Tremella mesenterica (strain ATCC 24925 / CBS 8224 / DSM 1558 / NBRC 9311 / NRRL Y-6157 / RJB 2259-6 / UBC 559-6) TaxID=578456 RepID=UPI00032CBFEA|nr:uncharacterized protein TREMEDRAFT_66348 [Tremella mesenterica DSM 1558]EIW65624.1 hypothetical protein TREMEDRAFT_66348 [Tremella mesenterica DSM 1558]